MTQSNAVAVQLQASDYVAAAQFLNRLQSQTNRRSGWMMGVLFFCVGLVIVVSDVQHGRRPVQGVGLWVMIALVYGFFYLNNHALIPRRVQRAYLRRKYGDDDLKLEWDDTRMIVETPVTRTTASWTEMTRWREDPRLFFLEFRGRALVYLPKRALQGAVSQDAFRQLLQAKIGPPDMARAG